MQLYHGTYIYFDKIDLNNSLDKRDFSMGFYTTTNFEQAIKRLKVWKCENQISFHTYRAIKRLKLVRWEYAD